MGVLVRVSHCFLGREWHMTPTEPIDALELDS